MPFLDVGATYAELNDELDSAYRRVMESGTYVLGDEVEAFEQEFAGYCGAEYCVAVASGLDALTLALRALGVGAGDEVVVPGHTFLATWLAVSAVGARPVAVDVEEMTGNLNPELLAGGIRPAVRAIVPVHVYGQPADLMAITAVADAHGIVVVEDAAQAHGAKLDGATVGSFGRAAGFSFYPTKNLGAFGDGGAIVTGDPGLAARARLQRNYGSARKYEHEVRGLNSRLDPLQAAFLRVKLAHLDAWNERRRGIANRYLEEIDERPGTIELPRTLRGAEPVWHVFAVRSGHRGELSRHLRSRGIDTLIHYPVPPHLSGAYADLGPWPPLPVSERLAVTVLSLPIGPHLGDESVSRVIEAVNEFTAGSVRGPTTMPGRLSQANSGCDRAAAELPIGAPRPAAIRPRTVPRVSCLMGTYLQERYIERALDTLLAQDYPSDALEIIVVDDGSPDRTQQLVEPYLERIRYIRKENAGPMDTVNVLVAAATGDYIAFFSGDDETPPSAVRRRVELLERRPEVGLCFGDMEVIDADGATITGSWATKYGRTARRGRVLGDLVRHNFVAGGTIMTRASLIPLFHPIPADVAWEDWWIALCVAEVAELDFIDQPISRYRIHGGNLLSGAQGAQLVRVKHEEIRLRRHILRTLDLSGVSPDDLIVAIGELRAAAGWVAAHDGLALEAVYDVSDADRSRASALAAEAVADLDRDPQRGIRICFRAFGHDPQSYPAATALRELLAAAAARAAIADEVDALFGSVRQNATLAFADELTAEPHLLAAYAAAVGPADPATLVIYAPDAEPIILEQQLLGALANAGVDEASCPDLVAVVMHGRDEIECELADRVHAVLSQRRLAGPFGGLPVFGAKQIAQP